VATLWLLARVRFPERPATPNPVPPLLTQLAVGPNFADLASEIARLHGRLQPMLLVFDRTSAGAQAATPVIAGPVTALRIRSDAAVMAVPAGARDQDVSELDLIAGDRASGLAVVRVSSDAPVVPPIPFAPERLEQPRYLIATTVAGSLASLRPVFVPSLHAVPDPAWSGPVWAVPEGTDLTAGSFVFTNDGELAGLAIKDNGRLAIVPGATLLADANRLVDAPRRADGYVGVEVQSLTPALAAATGGTTGVVATWVDPGGPAAKDLRVGDVIEAAQGQTVETKRHWDVYATRLQAGEAIAIRVRGREGVRELNLIAEPAGQPALTPSTLREPQGRPEPGRGTTSSGRTESKGSGQAPVSQEERQVRALGLTLRRVARTGSEVLRVDPQSAAAAAGLEAGDVITLIGNLNAPTPAQVRRAFASTSQEQPLLLAMTRGLTHRVLTLEK
jgi:S1-C subfamily serine protease